LNTSDLSSLIGIFLKDDDQGLIEHKKATLIIDFVIAFMHFQSSPFGSQARLNEV
jgi:hypothetical protein